MLQYWVASMSRNLICFNNHPCCTMNKWGCLSTTSYSIFFFLSIQGLPRPLFAFLRLFYAALSIGHLVWIGLDQPTGGWIIHLGNWSRAVTALYFLVGSLTAFHRSMCGSKESDKYDRITQDSSDPLNSNSCALKPGENDDSLPPTTNHLSWHHEVLWVLHTLAADSSFVCMIAYFAFFFKVRYTFLGILDVPKHVLHLVLMIVDTLASHIPVRLFHVMYAYMFGAAYVVFTIVFILTEVKIDLNLNPVFYPSLESGDEPLIYTAYLSIFLIAGFPVAQLFFFLLHKFRSWLISRWFGNHLWNKLKVKKRSMWNSLRKLSLRLC